MGASPSATGQRTDYVYYGTNAHDANIPWGMAGDDTLYDGPLGDDTLHGQAGNDALDGGHRQLVPPTFVMAVSRVNSGGWTPASDGQGVAGPNCLTAVKSQRTRRTAPVFPRDSGAVRRC